MDVQALMDELEAKTGVKITPEDFERLSGIMCECRRHVWPLEKRDTDCLLRNHR